MIKEHCLGRVTSRDIVNEINANSDIVLKPKDIIIKKIIKNIGEYTADLMPHPEVVKEIKIIVQTVKSNCYSLFSIC